MYIDFQGNLTGTNMSHFVVQSSKMCVEQNIILCSIIQACQSENRKQNRKVRYI